MHLLLPKQRHHNNKNKTKKWRTTTIARPNDIHTYASK